MNYRHLGSTGLNVSELSLGSWVTFGNQVGVGETVEMMAAAYDAGINFFDNAEVYAGGESERIMGEALKELGWRRGAYLVSTKLFWGLHDTPNERNTLNRKYLLEGIDGSLTRLHLDCVDLLFCHRPDPMTPVEETVWAMHDIIAQGKALYWGTSEWEPADIIAAIEIAERHHLRKPVVEQPAYNLFRQHRFGPAYDRIYADYGYGATTWSPLASGLLTGKYANGVPEGSRATIEGYEFLRDELTDKGNLEQVRKLEPIAEGIGASLAQFSIAWCLQNEYVSTVMLGASRLEQLEENLEALEFVDRITPEIMDEVDEIFA